MDPAFGFQTESFSSLLWLIFKFCGLFVLFSWIYVTINLLWLLQRNGVWWYRVITRQPDILVCSAFRSTPTRSCSEELFQHSTPLAAKDSASQDVITPDKSAPALQQEAESVGTAVIGAKLVAAQEESLTSPQCTGTPSPSHFLPGSTGLATTAKSRQQGQAWSENEDPRGGASWTECSLRATWAPSSYNTSWLSTSMNNKCLNSWIKFKGATSFAVLRMAWAAFIWQQLFFYSGCMETGK